MKILFTLLLLLPFWSCANQNDPSPAKSNEVILAVFESGTVTAKDLDREILSLPPQQRNPAQVDRSQWLGNLIEKIALDKIFLARAKDEGLERDVRFKRLERQIRRRHITNDYVRRQAESSVSFSDEVIETYYRDHAAMFEQKAQRQVYHLYRRISSDRPKEVVLREMADLRQRIIDGESLAALAKTYSDSESRHHGGQLGFISKGRFSEGFDEVVFNLPTGTPSKPMVTADGAHLFLVHSAVEEKKYPLEEVYPIIVQRLILESQQRKLAELASKLPLPEPFLMANTEEPTWFVSVADPSLLLLKMGGYELSAADFKKILLERKSKAGGAQDSVTATRLLKELRDREIIYQYLGQEEPSGVNRQVFDFQWEQALIEVYVKQVMLREVQQNRSQLQAHYETNMMRFASPVQFHLNRLRIGIDDHPVQQMALLEKARNRVASQKGSLVTLAAEFGGEIQDLGMKSIRRIQRRDPRAPFFAGELAIGGMSPPYRLNDHFVIVQLVAKKEPKPLPLALVKQRVAEDYLTHYGQRTFATLSKRVLAEVRFELKQDHPDALRGVGIPSTEP